MNTDDTWLRYRVWWRQSTRHKWIRIAEREHSADAMQLAQCERDRLLKWGTFPTFQVGIDLARERHDGLMGYDLPDRLPASAPMFAVLQ